VASDGFHTNGYSLLRKLLFERLALDLDDPFPETDDTVGDVLLRVHRSYLRSVHPLIEAGRIHALAHITGGGIPGNLNRSLPPDIQARVDTASWEVPPEFRGVMNSGGIERLEMFETFNMGVGLVLVVPVDEAQRVVDALDSAGERAWVMGELRERAGGEAAVRLD
jgi:phosphoribosylformylglycinamidine cyclo-ligase